jgi:hypothetical protein
MILGTKLSENSRLRLYRILKGTLVLALLVIHFFSRQHTAMTMGHQVDFYHDTHNYVSSYRCSLSLLAGKGFQNLGLPRDQASAEGEPIVGFFSLKREKISPNEFEAYLNTPDAEPSPASPAEPSRILDIYFTAILWKVFGISWPVYFNAACLASAFCCLLIFLMTRKLTGSFWAGILASVLFFAFPFENDYAIRSVRDISPLWFASVGFGSFICVVDSAKSRKWNLLTYFALGALSIVGEGWRPDAILVAPLLLAGLVVFLFIRHRNYRLSLAAACLFLAGGTITHKLIQFMGPKDQDASGAVFHVAQYGDSSRCNLIGLENSFQTEREDLQTIYNAAWFQKMNHPGVAFVPLNRQYGVVCREMYLAGMKYHLYQYLSFWPEFYLRAIGAFSHRGQIQGEDLGTLQQSRMHWALPVYKYLDRLILILPSLHFVGILTFYWIGRERIRGSFLILFCIYYSVILFAVLPENKHVGQLLLSMAVTGGMGLWGLARFARFFILRFDLRELTLVIPKQVRLVGYACLGVAGCWALACFVAHPYCVRQRDHYVNAIRELAAHAVDAKYSIKDPRVFSVSIGPGKPNPPTGYFLTILASDNPGLLECRHVHFPAYPTTEGRVFVTRHKLYPARLQYFAVSCIHSPEFGGDIRPYTCTVTVPSGCSLVGCRRLDLSNWKKLPFSTIICDGEHFPGSPVVGRLSESDSPSYQFNNLSSEISYGYPWHMLTDLGLVWDQNSTYLTLRPLPLVAAHEEGKATVLRSPRRNQLEACVSGLVLVSLLNEPGAYGDRHDEGIKLRIPPGLTGIIARSNPLVVEEDGAYLVKIKYRQTGLVDLSVKAISTGVSPVPHQQCLPRLEDDLPVRFLELRLKAGEPIQVQLVNQYPPGPEGGEIEIQEIQAYRERFPHRDW